MGDNVSSCIIRVKFEGFGQSYNLSLKLSVPRRFFRSLLNKQQSSSTNFFPGGRTEEDFKLLYGTGECGFRFPEQRVGERWVIVRCGLSNQIVKPLSLLVRDGDGLVVGTPRQNESRSSSDRLTDRLATEPYEPPLRLWVILNNSFLEKLAYPCGGDTWLWHGMVEPLADVE